MLFFDTLAEAKNWLKCLAVKYKSVLVMEPIRSVKESRIMKPPITKKYCVTEKPFDVFFNFQENLG
jgi:hypothetical protein